MDIINVVSVTSQAQVKQWYEENDEEIQHALYWRQAFDVRTYELSVSRSVSHAQLLLHRIETGSKIKTNSAANHRPRP